MSRYALVKDKIIIRGPDRLPKSYGLTSGLDKISVTELRLLGWLPWNTIMVDLPDDTWIHDTSIITISDIEVVEQQVIRKKTNEEIQEELDSKANNIRYNRNKKLEDSDWIIIKHIEKSVQNIEEWKEYRQLLRDITIQENFPVEVVWPEQPKKII
jgi:ASC-1-like (ASCH) protein